MKNLLACLALCASLSASAQVVYPYNPDANNDSVITSSDLLDFLPVFSTTFTPQGITINGVPFDEWLVDLESAVYNLQVELNAQNAIIDSLQNVVMTRDSVFDIAVGVAWRGEIAGVNLSGAYMPHRNLKGLNLNNAILSNANLEHADLSFTSLADAFFDGADLLGANLNGSFCVGTDFQGADLRYAQVASAYLGWAFINNADLSGCDLSTQDFSYSNLSGTTMTCLQTGCPQALPTGYICEPDPDCWQPNRYRIVPE